MPFESTMNATDPIRLLFVDDHPVIAAGLAARYADLAGFSVVGTTTTVKEGMALLHDVDVAVVDFQLESTLTPRQVVALAEHCRVVVFSARSDEAAVQQLLTAGASAVVNKAAALSDLDAVLREVAAGRTQPGSGSAGVFPRGSSGPLVQLSNRELEVYRGLVKCQTPKEIAAELAIARSTVYCHIDRIRQKLGVETLQEIVAHGYGESSS